MLFTLPFCFIFSHVSGNTSFPKPLSYEEEQYYLDELSRDNPEAKNILIERNLRLVAYISKKYNSKDNEDLISVGTIGLIKAIVTFNNDKGAKLATYASRCIENEILMYLRSTRKYSTEVFIQDPIGVDKEGNEVTIEDKLADECYSIDDQVHLKMQIRQLYDVINEVLTDREKMIIELRYGLSLGEETTQREIAELLDISRSYVSRIEKKSLKKLKKEIDRLEHNQ